jgi:hypothetical protein
VIAVLGMIGVSTAVFIGCSMELMSAAGTTGTGSTVIGAAAGSTEKAGDLAEREERRRDLWGVATSTGTSGGWSTVCSLGGAATLADAATLGGAPSVDDSDLVTGSPPPRDDSAAAACAVA